MKHKTICVLLAVFCLALKINSQQVPLYITENGYVFIDVIVNDSVKVRFLLDTGAGLCIISNKLFQRIKPSVTDAGIFTGFRNDGERLDMKLYTMPSVSIDNYRVQNTIFGVYAPLDEYGIDGVLSLKEFENQPFTISFKDKTFSMESPPALDSLSKISEQLPVLLHSQVDVSLDVFVTLCLENGVKLRAEFDTGSGYASFFINTFFMKPLEVDSTALTRQTNTTPITGKKYSEYLYKLPSYSYCGSGRLSGSNTNVLFKEGLIYEGLIGSGVFKDKALTIDIPNKRFLVH